MAWLKIDDRVRTHPKIAQAGPAAAWLWFCGICYCREHLTDGFIPKAVVTSLAMNLSSPLKHAARLVDVQLWDRANDGFAVHDFLDWNPSRAEVLSLRDKEKEKKRTYRGVPEGQREDNAGTTEGTSKGHIGDTSRVYAGEPTRDRAAGRGSGSLSVSGVWVSSGEKSAREGGPLGASRRSGEASHRDTRVGRAGSLSSGLDSHRRNCPEWAWVACERGMCVPKYLWQRLEQRGEHTPEWIERLRQIVADAMRDYQPDGTKPEAFWPNIFELALGSSTPQTTAGRKLSAAETTVAALRAEMARRG